MTVSSLSSSTSAGAGPVQPGKPRITAQVWLTDGRIFEAPVGSRLEEYMQAAGADRPWPAPVIAALIDNELRELTYRVEKDVEVTPLTTADWDGSRIYRRSLTFLLLAAVHNLYPSSLRIHVDHSVTFGGYYCEVEGRPNFTPDELALVENHMRELVAKNLPINKERLSLNDAAELFRRRGDDDKALLLAYRQKDYLTMYALGTFSNYFHGYMVPSTGYLRDFALTHYPPGFILRFPPRGRTELEPVVEYPKLINVFHEYHETLRLLGVDNVGALNQAIEAGRTNEIILVAEALHEQRIAQIAGQIAARRGQVKVVLMAGPSSSGKTTFSKRLAIQLLANGLRPVAVGLDDYFVDRELSPRDEQGNFDFEVLEALNLKRFNDDLLNLMAGREVRLPHFNFVTGKSEPGVRLQLGPDHIILIEGIHGLNPGLVSQVPADRIFRIYISALTQLNIDRHNRVPTTDTRLIRRIVRDARTRGYSAGDTIARWQSVRRGERLYIFPFQENADVMFNSALVYELSALKPLVEPLLLQIESGKPGHVEAKRLLAFLQWFKPMPNEPIPDNSILREFVGGSNLENLELHV